MPELGHGHVGNLRGVVAADVALEAGEVEQGDDGRAVVGAAPWRGWPAVQCVGQGLEVVIHHGGGDAGDGDVEGIAEATQADAEVALVDVADASRGPVLDVLGDDLGHELAPPGGRMAFGEEADGIGQRGAGREPLHGLGVGAGGYVYLDAERAEQFAGFAVTGSVLVGEGRGAGLSIGEKAAALFGEALGGAEVGEALGALPAGERVGELDEEAVVGLAVDPDGFSVDAALDPGDGDDNEFEGRLRAEERRRRERLGFSRL